MLVVVAAPFLSQCSESSTGWISSVFASVTIPFISSVGSVFEVLETSSGSDWALYSFSANLQKDNIFNLNLNLKSKTYSLIMSSYLA